MKIAARAVGPQRLQITLPGKLAAIDADTRRPPQPHQRPQSLLDRLPLGSRPTHRHRFLHQSVVDDDIGPGVYLLSR